MGQWILQQQQKQQLKQPSLALLRQRLQSQALLGLLLPQNWEGRLLRGYLLSLQPQKQLVMQMLRGLLLKPKARLLLLRRLQHLAHCVCARPLLR